jgi:hypothetical protein
VRDGSTERHLPVGVNEQGALLVTIVELDPGEEHPGYHEVLTSRPWLRVGDVD